MCYHGFHGTDAYTARNGSIIGVIKQAGKWLGTVIKSASKKTPIGSQVEYKSVMGHVLCEGHSDRECDLHELDVTRTCNDPKYWVTPEKIESLVKEARRRSRYNAHRRSANRDLLFA